MEEEQEAVRVLGVCGGIGSGKSTACKLLVNSCGCLAHIDADTVAHSVYAPGSKAVADVADAFGTSVLAVDAATGDPAEPIEIDRAKLGPVVFADRSEMARLEAIVWPHVRDRLVERIAALRDSWDPNGGGGETAGSSPVIVLEAAVLLDAGWDDLLDGVWVVTASRETALRRLVETRGLSEAEAAKRIDAQESRRGMGPTGLADEQRRGTVQSVVSNDGSRSDLERALRRALDDPACWRNPPPQPPS